MVGDVADGADTVVFDLGGVLIDWDPRYLYRKLIADEVELEGFLAQVCNQAWNVRQDAGRSFSEAVVELAARHPGSRALIEAYWERWPEMLAAPSTKRWRSWRSWRPGGCRFMRSATGRPRPGPTPAGASPSWTVSTAW